MNPLTQITNGPLFKIFLTMSLAVLIMAILPSTPFMEFLEDMQELPYLNYLNWFLPIGRCLIVMTAWWTAVVIYYAISWILRNLDLVGH